MLHMSTATTSPARQLGPEPWGRKLLRAREDIARLRLADAAELASTYMLTSTAAISRLESRHDMPTGSRSQSQRQRAYILCVAYGVDPAELGLSPEDLPPNMEIEPRTPGELGISSTEWYDDTPGHYFHAVA